MKLRAYLTTLQERIDARTLRERVILFVLFAALLFLLADRMLISPQERVQKGLLADTAKVRAEIALLEQQKLEVVNRAALDPNAEELQRLQQLGEAGAEVERQIVAAVDGLIDPREMARALEGVLKGQRKLTFVRIENLGAKPLLDVAPAVEQGGDAGIYKHTLRIELEGSFHHTREYLQALEQLPWRFHWEAVELEMVDYPRARVVITVNTLSLSKEWIGV